MDTAWVRRGAVGIDVGESAIDVADHRGQVRRLWRNDPSWRALVSRASRVGVCVADDASDAERERTELWALSLGARRALAVEGILAAAIGCGLPVAGIRGCVIADVGASGARVALLADGTILDGRRRADVANAGAAGIAAMIGAFCRDVVRAGWVDAADAGLTLVGGGACRPALVDALVRALPVEVVVPSRPWSRAALGARMIVAEDATAPLDRAR